MKLIPILKQGVSSQLEDTVLTRRNFTPRNKARIFPLGQGANISFYKCIPIEFLNEFKGYRFFGRVFFFIFPDIKLKSRNQRFVPYRQEKIILPLLWCKVSFCEHCRLSQCYAPPCPFPSSPRDSSLTSLQLIHVIRPLLRSTNRLYIVNPSCDIMRESPHSPVFGKVQT